MPIHTTCPCKRRQGPGVLNIAPHVASLRGVAILLVSLGLNLFGDGLRDALDPRIAQLL